MDQKKTLRALALSTILAAPATPTLANNVLSSSRLQEVQAGILNNIVACTQDKKCSADVDDLAEGLEVISKMAEEQRKKRNMKRVLKMPETEMCMMKTLEY
jgi:hypothetical protein